MKPILFLFFICLAACGQGDAPSRQTIDSVNQKPVADSAQQIPGTAGASGSDSTRKGALPPMTAKDSAR